MKLLGNKKSKRQKTSLKYNIAKRVREHRRRIKKEAKKQGVYKKNLKKDPGIPNAWPFKAEMIAELEAKKEKRELEIEERRANAKTEAKRDRKKEWEDKAEAVKERDFARNAKRADEVERNQKDALKRIVERADVLVQVLDARDPLGCRCPALEAWAQQNNRRLVFVIAKADLVPAQAVAEWVKRLGQEAPTVAVQAEAGRDGVKELLQMLGRSPGFQQVAGGIQTATAVGIVGYTGTGKRMLSKAIRAEFKAATPWLLDAVGRLRLTRQLREAPDTTLAMHNAVRGVFPTKRGVQPVEEVGSNAAVVTQLLQRAPAQSLMRRLRLPAFEGLDGFLKAFGTDRNIKNKRGNPGNPQSIALQVLVSLIQQPGCFCSPPEVAQKGASDLWGAHASAKQAVEALMTAQHGVLSAREPGPMAAALVIASAGFGPEVGAGSFAPADDGEGGDSTGEESDDDNDMEGEEEESGEEDEDAEEEDEEDMKE